MEKLLSVENLEIDFRMHIGDVKAVRGISFHIHEGETLAVVGESGCGKTVTVKGILRLLKTPPTIFGKDSKVLFRGEDVLKMDKKRLARFRGGEASMIFQDPMTSLNPTMTIGKQIMEALKLHRNMNKVEAEQEAIRLLELVNIPRAAERIGAYPHELSGGMRQRVMIAIALSCNPQILIADEPTTALDVTIQAQIIDLLKELKDKLSTAIILVTHDLGVVANFAERVQVMYAGKIVETGTKQEIFYESKHPYTWALLKSVPRLDADSKSELYALRGTPPDLILPLKGCAFAARCDHAMAICHQEAPVETIHSSTHQSACWLSHPMADRSGTPYDIGGEHCGA